MRAELQRDRRPPLRTDFQSLVRVRGHREKHLCSRSQTLYLAEIRIYMFHLQKAAILGEMCPFTFIIINFGGFTKFYIFKNSWGFCFHGNKNLRAKFPNFAGTVLMVSMFDGKAKNDKSSVSQREQSMIKGTFPSVKENKISNSENMVHSGLSWIEEFETF